MPSRSDQIRNKAIELLKNNPEGYRYSDLHRELQKIFPDFPSNTIQGSTWNLDIIKSDVIYKPSRGLFKYKFEDESVEGADNQKQNKVNKGVNLKEEDFYRSFADWIKNDLDECTEAIALGGNSLGKKWGTPDVLGVYKASPKDVIKFQTEILSAEIKIDPKEPITAFGQAVSYRLFSSKVYLVEPANIAPEDLDRIEALSMLFGIGLILFDLNKMKPNYRIRVRAQRHIPDMFYANELADRLFKTNSELFRKLF